MYKKILVLVLFSQLLFGCLEQLPQKKDKDDFKSLRFVAWNIEHLAETNGEGCRPRYDEDYKALRDYAESLDADIIALQEVESIDAVARVFPEEDWSFVISQRPPSDSYECWGNGNPSTQQKVAFAIRKGIKFDAKSDYQELGLGIEGLRHGVIIRLTGTPEPVDIMAVHLKSGCFVEDFSISNSEACEIFEQQVPVLDQWIESKINQNQKFVVLGDFNHRISNTKNTFWQQLTEMNNQPVVIKNSMANLAGCHPRYPEPIDHILFGTLMNSFLEVGSERVHYFGDDIEGIKEDEMLSDHCAVSVVFDFN